MDAGLNATTILVRRIKQGAAEWCRFQVKERAWNGFREHTMDGYDIGTRPTATPPAASHTPPPPGQPRPAPRPGSPPIPNGLGIITPNCPSLFDWSPARLAGCTQKWHLLITCAASPVSSRRGPGFRPGRRHRPRGALDPAAGGGRLRRGRRVGRRHAVPAGPERQSRRGHHFRQRPARRLGLCGDDRVADPGHPLGRHVRGAVLRAGRRPGLRPAHRGGRHADRGDGERLGVRA